MKESPGCTGSLRKRLVVEGEITDQRVDAIATSISSFIAAYPPSPEVEIPGAFLDDVIHRFAGRGTAGR